SRAPPRRFAADRHDDRRLPCRSSRIFLRRGQIKPLVVGIISHATILGPTLIADSNLADEQKNRRVNDHYRRQDGKGRGNLLEIIKDRRNQCRDHNHRQTELLWKVLADEEFTAATDDAIVNRITQL